MFTKKIVYLLYFFVFITIVGIGAFLFLPRGTSFSDTLLIIKSRLYYLSLKPKGNFPSLKLEIPSSSMRSLERDRTRSINAGLLKSENKNYVPGKLFYKGKETSIKIKLKGWGSEHWSIPVKWSFKVKPKECIVEGLAKFGLLYPPRRGYSIEWLYQRIVKFTGNLPLHYQFVDLTLNGMYLGTYAIEEAFDRKMNAVKEIDNGVIIKWDHSTWSDTLDYPAYFNKLILILDSLPEKKNSLSDLQYMSMPIVVQGKKNNSGVAKTAIKLMNDFRNNIKPTNEVFNIDKLATTVAVNHLFGNHHPMALQNLRFLYDPMTSRFEIIAYDLEQIDNLSNIESCFRYLAWKSSKFTPQHVIQMFNDTIFRKLYVKTQLKIADTTYLNSLFSELDYERHRVNRELTREFPHITFIEKKIIYQNAEFIRLSLDSINGSQ
ncbi:MAG: CotH kinase family protein [Flavobacteriales bacterium]|nr:CotH kinase family protein [Flavobacteriales bacterium]